MNFENPRCSMVSTSYQQMHSRKVNIIVWRPNLCSIVTLFFTLIQRLTLSCSCPVLKRCSCWYFILKCGSFWCLIVLSLCFWHDLFVHIIQFELDYGLASGCEDGIDFSCAVVFCLLILLYFSWPYGDEYFIMIYLQKLMEQQLL